MSENVLVTGGAGYIGIHASLLLIEKGFKVTIIDSLVNSSIKPIERLKKHILENKYLSSKQLIFQKGDVRDRNFLKSVFFETFSKTILPALLFNFGSKNLTNLNEFFR